MSLVWATRGRTWGFRFLRDGGLPDPLPVYDTAFSGVEDEPEAFRRNAETVALRFADPLGRRDVAGRVIPHEFVALGQMIEGIDSIEDGRQLVWPLVAEEFERVWTTEKPPSAHG